MNVREFAVDAIAKILKENAYSNITVNDYLNYSDFGYDDRRLFTNLVYGTVENKIYLDYLLKPFLRGKNIKPWVRDILRMSVYQIIFLSIPDYAVINEAVEMAKKKDFMVSKLVNGVLRTFLRTERPNLDLLDKKEMLSIRYSYPLWLVELLEKQYGLDLLEEIMIQSAKVSPTTIRVNTLKSNKEYIKHKLDELSIEFEDSKLVKDGMTVSYPVQSLELFLSGLITIQDIASQMVAEMMDPKENEVILDACSAPGGKTAHLAGLSGNKANIYASDIHDHKLEIMSKGLKRLGVGNVSLINHDAKTLSEKFRPEFFDKILIDAPCSGLGVVSHKAEIKYTMTQEKIDKIIEQQSEILKGLKDLVKVGGELYYSTCTINKEENQVQIERFLQENPQFEKQEERVILPVGEELIDGFYIAKLKRRTI
jgi:16S rRNA (cytosine967-C5)-methyltransferase